MKAIRTFFKLLACAGHLLRGMWTIIRQFGHLDGAARSVKIAQWAQQLLAILQVQLESNGQPQTQGPLLVVANHVSWLDIVVMLAVQPVCFVSKSEVKSWPIIGWLATHAGTLYIERASRRDALRVVHSITEALQQGKIIAVFPEGTTTDGASVKAFHANLLQAAVSAKAPVQPVALQFLDRATGQRSMSPVYIDDDTLVSSVWRMLSADPVQARLHFLTPVSCEGMDRRELAARLHEQLLAVIQPHS